MASGDQGLTTNTPTTWLAFLVAMCFWTLHGQACTLRADALARDLRRLADA